VTDLGPYPDARAAVIDVLADLVAASYAGPATLASIQAGSLPAVRVTRTGGSDDGFTDTSDIAVAVFAGDATAAWSVAQACHQRLTSLRLSGNNQGTPDGLIDHVQVTQSPQLVTASDTVAVQAATAAYQISMRRTAQ
jgi:hypothetical protein